MLDPAGRVQRTVDSAALGNARRPHMLWGVPGDGFVYSANTVSNSVTVLDRSDGSIKAVIQPVRPTPRSPIPRDPTGST
ncbi:MAG TPA: hypothetical protein VFU41_08925 [Gemmatimonadales bacterium]|nr:hypothetical protein [Gemmatimonadales bacterium]